MKSVLNKIDPVSAGKMLAVLFAIVQLVESILLLASPQGAMFGSSMMARGVSSLGIASIIVFPILGLVFGFILGAIVALVYNFLVPSIGGIKIELK